MRQSFETRSIVLPKSQSLVEKIFLKEVDRPDEGPTIDLSVLKEFNEYGEDGVLILRTILSSSHFRAVSSHPFHKRRSGGVFYLSTGKSS